MDFLKRNWIWLLVGVVIFFVLYELFFSGSSSASAAPAVAGDNGEGAQIAAINSQTATNQIGASVAIAQSENSLAATKDTNAAAVTINQAQVDSQNLVTSTGANVSLAAIAATLQATIHGQDIDFAALHDTNLTQLSEYGIQGAVASQQISAAQDISKTALAVQQNQDNLAAGIASQQLSNFRAITDSIQSDLGAGVFNKGGEGGTNQVGVATTLINPNAAASANGASATVGATAASSNSISGILNSVANLVGVGGKTAVALGA